MNPKLQQLFAEYAESHRHPTNQLTHKVAIPAIVFHIIAMLDWVRLFTIPGSDAPFTLAYVAIPLAGAWYLMMSPKLGVLMLGLTALCVPLGRLLPWPAIVGIAVVGWLVQLAGHVVWEKKSPSFLTNLVHALVGPAFFLAKLTGDLPSKAETATTRAS